MKTLKVNKQAMVRTYHLAKLTLKKYTPEILTGIGIAGVIGSTVIACKSTLKVEEILDKHNEMMDNIREAEELVKSGTLTEMDYTDEEIRRDKAITTIQTGVKLLKLYGPAIALESFSITCIIAGHAVLTRRNLALVAAYDGLKAAYEKYRQRVIEDYGEDVDRMYRTGRRKEVIEEKVKDEKGRTRTEKREEEKFDPNAVSQYARFFDESSRKWSKTPEYNLLFLKSQQNFANDRLQARGYLFLNEVYEALGLQPSQAGSVVGWIISKDGDNTVDFGIFDMKSPEKRAFVNGFERNILLDFNVDGVIYDKVPAIWTERNM